MSKANKHVVPNPKGGWSVRTSGSARAGKVFGTQQDAVTYARGVARKSGGELYIHGKDGTIRGRDSYAKAPTAPKYGKK
jgi:hypothetical protein